MRLIGVSALMPSLLASWPLTCSAGALQRIVGHVVGGAGGHVQAVPQPAVDVELAAVPHLPGDDLVHLDVDVDARGQGNLEPLAVHVQDGGGAGRLLIGGVGGHQGAELRGNLPFGHGNVRAAPRELLPQGVIRPDHPRHAGGQVVPAEWRYGRIGAGDDQRPAGEAGRVPVVIAEQPFDLDDRVGAVAAVAQAPQRELVGVVERFGRLAHRRTLALEG
jgi:hypothetical protein